MNILIFDTNNTLHQFHASKRWINKFINNPAFFSLDSTQLDSYIQEMTQDTCLETKCIKTKVNNFKELAAIDFTISSDYGLSLVDFKEKKVFSISNYSSVGLVLRSQYDLAFIQQDEDALKMYRELLSKSIFIPENNENGEAGEKLIQKINDCLKSGVINRAVNKANFLINKGSGKDFGDLVVSASCGWEMHHSDEKEQTLVIKIIDHLFDKKISMSAAQQRACLQSYSEFLYGCYIEDDDELDPQLKIMQFEQLLAIKSEKNKLGYGVDLPIKINKAQQKI